MVRTGTTEKSLQGRDMIEVTFRIDGQRELSRTKTRRDDQDKDVPRGDIFVTYPTHLAP